MSVVAGISNLFCFCYFGKLSIDSYEKMVDCVFETNWYDAPVELQKYFIMMIANMQRPLHYHGFKVAVLDLETFSAVSSMS